MPCGADDDLMADHLKKQHIAGAAEGNDQFARLAVAQLGPAAGEGRPGQQAQAFANGVQRALGRCPVRRFAGEFALDGEVLQPAQVRHIQDLALRAFHVIGCRDYARVDMRVAADTGQPYILEVNPNPDLADSCAFAQCVRASGRTYAQAMNELVHYALERAKVGLAKGVGPWRL